MAGDLVHLARRDGPGEPDGRRAGLRRQAQLRLRRAEPSNFIGSYGQGYVSYGNQPGLEVAHLFNYVGFPWLTQHWVRQVKEKTFGATSTTDGYGHHDEDQGQMGALSALMAIGLFEVTGGGLEKPIYDVTSPIFERGPDRELRRKYCTGTVRDPLARTVSTSSRARLERAQCSTTPGSTHDKLADGGALDIWLGDRSRTSSGASKKLPFSESRSEGNTSVLATAVAVAGPERIEVPYGTAQFSASFTPEDTTLKHVYWTVTEPDGSPTDKAEIDGEGLLKVKHLDGQVLVTATAADASGVKGSQLVTLDLDPALLRGNAARWPGVKATASSEFDAGYPAAKVHDGVIGQKDGGDWASRGEREPWVQLDFAEPVRTDRIVIYDRPGTQDDINGGELTFSDGSTVAVSGVPADGTREDRRVPAAHGLLGALPGPRRQRAEPGALRARGPRDPRSPGRARERRRDP